MYCPFCGYELPNNAIFCQRCGKRLPDYDNTESQYAELKETASVNSINSVGNPIRTNNTSLPKAEDVQSDSHINPHEDISQERVSISQIEKQSWSSNNRIGKIIAIGIIILFIALVIPNLDTNGDLFPYTEKHIPIPVSSNPSGADVYIWGEYQGKTPLTLELMPNTGYQIVIKKEGYEQWSNGINSGDGTHAKSVHVSLTPISTHTPTYTPKYQKSVSISSNPNGAEIYIGGKYQGKTPLTLELMPNTDYTMVIKKDGYQQRTDTINTGEGVQAISVYFPLTPKVSYIPIVTQPVYTPPVTPTTNPSTQTISDEYIEKNYIWDYGGYTWTYTSYIPRNQYLYYKNLDRKPNNYQEYISNTYNRQLTSKIADLIVEEGLEKGFSKDQCVLMAVSFVQSIPYKTDKESTGMDEYYKYPIETLVEGCGDCEDSAILTATIVRDMGYGVVLLRFYDHMAIGVKGGENMHGTYWTYNGERYFYLETTNTGWEIGQIPDKYRQERATIIPLS